MPEPSPITKPSRPRSNGRDARVGSPVPATARRACGSRRSRAATRPPRHRRRPSPRRSRRGSGGTRRRSRRSRPRRPCRSTSTGRAGCSRGRRAGRRVRQDERDRERATAGRRRAGEGLGRPRAASRRRRGRCRCAVPMSRDSRPRSPASSSAIAPGTAASRPARSMRRAARWPNRSSASSPSVTGKPLMVPTPSSSTWAAPERPSASASQKGPTPAPSGLTTPAPVITTRRRTRRIFAEPAPPVHRRRTS